MARISSYAIDSNVELSDKVLGTDSQGLVTKNFDFNAVKAWLNSTSVVGIVGQNSYRFETIGPRGQGTVSFPSIGGDETPFSNITQLVFSTVTAGNYNAEEYLNLLVNKRIIFSDVTNPANFGIFTLTALTDYSEGFLLAELTFEDGIGEMTADNTYGTAPWGLEAPDITTVEAPVNPKIQFIANDRGNPVSGERLGTIAFKARFDDPDVVDAAQAVFSAFKTRVEADGGNVEDTDGTCVLPEIQFLIANAEFFADTFEIQTEYSGADGNFNADLVFNTNSSGTLTEKFRFKQDGELQAESMRVASLSYPTTDGTDGQVIQTDGNGNLTFATAGGGETPTLQTVTDAGNTTTNSITSQSVSLDAENGGGIFNSTYSDVNILPKSNAFEFNVRTSSSTGRLRVSTDGALYLASNANAINLGRLYSGQYPKKQLQLGLTGSGYTAFFDSNGVNELMRIDGATGNVGIGTTVPSEKLHVQGAAPKFKLHNTNGFDTYVELYTGSGYSGIKVNKDFSIVGHYNPLWQAEAGVVVSNQYFYGGYIKFRKRGGTTDLAKIGLETGSNTYFNTGNFGIGTTAPAQKLHVDGTIRIGADVDLSRYAGMLYTPQRVVLGSQNSEGANITINANSAYSAIGVRRPSSGTTSILKVRDYSTQDVYIDIDSDGVADFAGMVKTDAGFEAYRVGARRVFLGGTSTKGQLLLDNNGTWDVNLTGGSNKYFASGNFGIGTTSPDSKLHIKGSFGNNTFKVKPNADHTIIEAGQEFRIATTNSGDIKFQPGGVIGMLISGTNRNVGIGTTAPDSKLEVEGTAMRQFRIKQAGGPSSNTDVSGREGDFAYDDNYVYVKTTNGWGRVALDFGF